MTDGMNMQYLFRECTPEFTDLGFVRFVNLVGESRCLKTIAWSVALACHQLNQ